MLFLLFFVQKKVIGYICISVKSIAQVRKVVTQPPLQESGNPYTYKNLELS